MQRSVHGLRGLAASIRFHTRGAAGALMQMFRLRRAAERLDDDDVTVDVSTRGTATSIAKLGGLGAAAGTAQVASTRLSGALVGVIAVLPILATLASAAAGGLAALSSIAAVAGAGVAAFAASAVGNMARVTQAMEKGAAAVAKVRRHMGELRGQPTVGEPKSRAGKRDAPLLADLGEVLRNHRRRQLRRRMAAGQWTDHDLVITDEHGEAVVPHRLTRLFSELTRDAGLPPIRLHDCRRSCNTWLRNAGVDPMFIRLWLGWSTPDSDMHAHYWSPTSGDARRNAQRATGYWNDAGAQAELS